MFSTIKAKVWDGNRKYILIGVAVVVIAGLMYFGVPADLKPE